MAAVVGQLCVSLGPHICRRRQWPGRRPAAACRAAGVRTVELSGRDRDIVQHVARFRQLSTSHIYELLFTTASRTPCDDALKRLTARKYLNQIERARLVGGSRGGSGQYVYSLGYRGWQQFVGTGKYTQARTVNYHALQVFEVYAALRRMEQQDDARLFIAGYSTEPDCHVQLGGELLMPD